jgi:hypothetical protein
MVKKENPVKGKFGKLKPERDNLFRTTTPVPPLVAKESNQSHTERVTLPLTPDQKDLLDDLGKKLQRQRTNKEHDLNRNTIIRSLIALLDEHTFDDVSVNTEQELSAWMRKRFVS